MNEHLDKFDKEVWDFTSNPEGVVFDDKKAFSVFMNKTKIGSVENTIQNSSLSSKKTTSFFFNHWKSVVAAATIATCSIFALSLNNDTILLDSKGSDITYILPDGSSVKLFPNSTIEYNKQTYNTKRDLKLTGKALFDIEKNHVPMQINCKNFEVQVLGTTFLINEEEVKVLEGKVAIIKNDKKVNLLSREAVRLVENEIIVSQDVSFKDDKIVFKHIEYKEEPLSRVISDLESLHGVEILVGKKDLISNCYITSKELSQKTMAVALEIIKVATGLEILPTEFSNKKFYIKGTACK
jgi:hypothetical protein